MNKTKNKIVTITIAVFLMLSMTASMIMVPTTSAASSMTTYPFIGAVPNPSAVGHRTLIHFGITEGLGAVDQGYTGLTVTVTKPDNTTETLGPFRTDSTGGTSTYYTPTMAGTYYLQTNFPQQTLQFDSSRTQPKGTVMLASTSTKLALNVTEDDTMAAYPSVPLPTEFWDRPIDAQATEWYTIAGNWLAVPPNRLALYNDNAPDSAHILWAKSIQMGGLVGGLYGDAGPVSMETGDAYEGYFSSMRNGMPSGIDYRSSVIINGKLYYNDYSYRASSTTNVEQNVICVDLHTGEQLWERNWNNTRLAFGQLFYWQSYNYQGTYAFLWSVHGTTWDAYDAESGRWLYTMTNMPAGNVVFGPRGEIYIYYMDLAHGWMMLWNSSRVISDMGSFSQTLVGQTFNCDINTYKTRVRNSGYEWNKTIPTGLPGSVRATYFNNKIIGADLGVSVTTGYSDKVTVWALSTAAGQEGTLLYNNTWTKPTDMANNQTISWKASNVDDKVGIIWSKELTRFYGINLDNGNLLWGPTASTGYLDFYEGTGLTSEYIAYGKFYTVGLDGVVHCYNDQTGDLLWTYTAKDVYHETEIGNNWWLGICFIADGKVYLCHGEHSPNMPLPQGAPFLCLNATTGDKVWEIDSMQVGTGWGGLPMIGDSIITALDQYDNRIYAIGKGPSAISVTAPDVGVTTGNNIVIRGTVNDISPGTQDSALTMRFPNGVPAVSDASMSDWMLYVYKQFARPTNATGVPVSISVIDSNNNFRTIGTTTSDISGTYALTWTPDIPGDYTVYASFAGSQSYYASSAETHFTASLASSTPAPTATAASNLATTTDLMLYIVGAAVAIIIAIAIVGVLMLRKRS